MQKSVSFLPLKWSRSDMLIQTAGTLQGVQKNQ